MSDHASDSSKNKYVAKVLKKTKTDSTHWPLMGYLIDVTCDIT